MEISSRVHRTIGLLLALLKLLLPLRLLLLIIMGFLPRLDPRFDLLWLRAR